MKLYTEESLKELKEEIDLPRVLNALGYDKSYYTPVYDCPFCSQENSLVLDSDDTRYYCFECEAKGDAIELIMSGWGQSFEDAVNFLSIMFNCLLDISEPNEEATPEKKKKKSVEDYTVLQLELATLMKDRKISDSELLTLAKAFDYINENKPEVAN